jgi:putative transposase
MTEHVSQLAIATEAQREQVLERFSLIQPFLEGDIPLTHVAAMQQLPLRTLRQWVQRYRQKGLVGLMRKGRSDRGKRRGLPADLVRQIEGLALHRPARSIAAIHRQATKVAIDQGWQSPSYSRVYAIVRSLDQPW